MYPGMEIDQLDQQAMAKALYGMIFERCLPGAEFNQIIHENFLLEDEAVAVKLQGREMFWSAVDIPIEDKRALCFSSEFVEYIGVPDNGNVRWRFRPAAGYAAALWGINVKDYVEEDAPEIEVVGRISFKDDKIHSTKEIWDPSPLLRTSGAQVPVPVSLQK